MAIVIFIRWVLYRLKALRHPRFCSLYPPLTWKQYKAYKKSLTDHIDTVFIWNNADGKIRKER